MPQHQIFPGTLNLRKQAYVERFQLHLAAESLAEHLHNRPPHLLFALARAMHNESSGNHQDNQQGGAADPQASLQRFADRLHDLADSAPFPSIAYDCKARCTLISPTSSAFEAPSSPPPSSSAKTTESELSGFKS